MNNFSNSQNQQDLANLMAVIDRKFEPVPDIQKTTDKFYELLSENQFWPHPNILSKFRQTNVTLLNQTALSPTDDFQNIFDTLKLASILLQHQIEVAIDFSNLRASRSQISSGPRQSLGPVKFMELFEKAPQSNTNQTALHYYFELDHLDCESLLNYACHSPNHIKLTIGIPSQFMLALSENKSFGLKHKKNQKPNAQEDAHKILKKLHEVAQCKTDLNLIFIDKVNNLKIRHQILENTSLNIDNQIIHNCELTSCGALNLQAFLKNESLDQSLLANAITNAIRFLDNCFEQTFYPDEQIKNSTQQKRRINLSVIGWQHVIQVLNPEQGPKKSMRLLKSLIDFITKQSLLASQSLGHKRGLKNRILFNGHWYKTRHCQLLSLNQKPYFSFMTKSNYDKLEDLTYEIWQEGINNIISYPQSFINFSLEDFQNKLLESFQKNIYCLSFGKDNFTHDWAKIAS